MKNEFLRWPVSILAISSLVLCARGADDKVPAAGPVPIYTPGTPVPEPVVTAEAPVLVSTNGVPAQPTVKVVQTPAPPAEIKPSPALAEVIKLVQAGVGEEVTRAYVANSTGRFNVSSDQIVYLNDLGVSNDLITSLIQHDSALGTSPNPAGVATPLPPGLALTSPAPNVYPGTSPPQTAPAAVDPNAPNTAVTAPLTNPDEAAAPPDFYNSLSPYGTWIDVGGYGRCWQPTVAVVTPSWRPYCERGHWVWTDAGWYWYSDYSWGWAPFHYGRWCTYPRLGWFWVPDTCWGPSWVSWRYTSSHCGWAPLPPRVVLGAHGFYHGGVDVGFGFDFGLGVGLYTFVELGHLSDPSPYRHRLSPSQATVVYNHSTVINNYTVDKSGTVINHGVAVEKVARASGHKIPTVAIQTAAPAAPGRPFRHEQLEKNGTALAVVRSSAANSSRPIHITSATQIGNHDAANASSPLRLAPSAKTADPKQLAGKSANESVPVFRGRQEQPATSLRSQETARNNASTWTPEPSHPLKAPSVSPWASSDGKPQPRSMLIPPAGQQPVTTPSPSSSRTVAVAPANNSEPYRVYPAPGAASRSANPRVDNPAQPFGRPSFSSPASPAPSRPAPSMTAPPSHRSESARTPSMRSEPSRAPAAAPSVSHSAPARSDSGSTSRSGGGKRD